MCFDSFPKLLYQVIIYRELAYKQARWTMDLDATGFWSFPMSKYPFGPKVSEVSISRPICISKSSFVASQDLFSGQNIFLWKNNQQPRFGQIQRWQ